MGGGDVALATAPAGSGGLYGGIDAHALPDFPARLAVRKPAFGFCVRGSGGGGKKLTRAGVGIECSDAGGDVVGGEEGWQTYGEEGLGTLTASGFWY